MSLRDHLAELLGAEIQPHKVQWGKRQQLCHFRQISDAEGRALFAPAAEGVSDEEHGKAIAVKVIAASLCTPSGEQVATPEEVAALQTAVRNALFEKAAITNGLELMQEASGADAQSAGEGEDGPKP